MKERKHLVRSLVGVVVAILVLGVLLSQNEVAQSQTGQTCCGFTDYTDNRYGCGQCVWYASYKRPDIPDNVRWGNARNWDDSAPLEGFSVGTEPRRGAIVVFESGVGGAESAGHVAYVESVEGDTFTVSHMNFCGRQGCPGCLTTSTFNVNGFRSGDLHFIYPPLDVPALVFPYPDSTVERDDPIDLVWYGDTEYYDLV